MGEKDDASRLACLSLSLCLAVCSVCRYKGTCSKSTSPWRSGELFRSQKQLDPCLRELLQLSTTVGSVGSRVVAPRHRRYCDRRQASMPRCILISPECCERPNLYAKYKICRRLHAAVFQCKLRLVYPDHLYSWARLDLPPASTPQVPLHSVQTRRTRSSLWPELTVLETTFDEAVGFVRLHSARYWKAPRTSQTTTHAPAPLTAEDMVPR